MTVDEMWDFLGEHCYGMTYVKWSVDTPSVYILECYGISTTRGEWLEDAVQLAKAKWEKANK